jgi:hypothetical protein
MKQIEQVKYGICKNKKTSTYVEILKHIKQYWFTEKPVRREWYYSDRSLYADFKSFARNYSHNDNDGIYFKGHWDRRTRPTGKIVFNEEDNTWDHEMEYYHVWIEPKFTPHTLRVTDSLGRIINAKDLWKDAQKIRLDDKSTWQNYSYRNYRPGTRTGRRNGHWHKYDGDHGGFGMEARSSIGFINDLECDEDFYGMNIKYNRSRAKFVEMAYTDWDCIHYHNSKGRGWKRSRKDKQWM